MAIANNVFVKAWTKADSVAEVAELLDMTTATATARACVLRKAGVKLKSFPRGRKAGSTLDIDALNALICGDDTEATDTTETAPEATDTTETAPEATEPVEDPKARRGKPVKLVVADDGDDD